MRPEHANTWNKDPLRTRGEHLYIRLHPFLFQDEVIKVLKPFLLILEAFSINFYLKEIQNFTLL